MIQIYIGSLTEPDYVFTDDNIYSVSSTQSVALVGQELSIDTFTPVVLDSEESTKDIFLFRSADGKTIRLLDGANFAIDVMDAETPSLLIDIPNYTPLWYYRDNELIGKFFIETVNRLSKKKYQLNCVSTIGRLDKMYHGGGLFQVSTFGAVLQHILASGLHGEGAPVIDYAIDDDVADLTVSGWLPYASKRNNLYQLIFSNGVNIIKNADGNPRFTFVYTNSEASEPIPDSDIFISGNVEYIKPYSEVSIMEHTYSDIDQGVNAVTLYDNTESARVENEEIWFDQAPIIVSTLQATEGLTVVSATENSAIIIGNGKLTGIPYTHTTRTVSRKNETGDKEKTVSVEKCTMVNTLNSENLLNRLYAFYCPPDNIKKIQDEIKYTTQRCGKQYLFTGPYGETHDALLSKMDVNATTFNRARCEWYAGYDPVGQQGLYQHCIILDKSTFEDDGGTFTTPEGIDQMKVVLIGGGTGGWSGNHGENGQNAMTYIYVYPYEDMSGVWQGAEGGDGGQGGQGGSPAHVYSVVIENPDASYSYTIGDGGEGGEPTAQGTNRGSDGTASTFGSYTSADEASYVPVGGVYNPIYGEFYALNGNKGQSGGKGGARRIGDGETFAWVTDGEDVTGPDGTVYRGGRTGSPLTRVEGLPECRFTSYGGNGAGAAVGVGSDMTDEETEELLYPAMNGGSDQTASWEVTEDG